MAIEQTKEERKAVELAAWNAFVEGVKGWANVHMDQWEKIKFPSEQGHIYVTVSRRDLYPDSFDEV